MGKKRRSSSPGGSGVSQNVNPERLAAARKRRQKTVITWALVAAALAVAALLAYSLWPKPSPYVGFAECLTEKGAVMYGTDWCSHCQAQKRLFGSAFKSVAYVNCDASRACAERAVTGYPTWIFADGSRLEGQQQLAVLAEKTGCDLPITGDENNG